MKLFCTLSVLLLSAGAVAPLHAERDSHTGKPKTQVQMASERNAMLQKLQKALSKADGADLLVVTVKARHEKSAVIPLDAQQYQNIKQILSHVEVVPPPRTFHSVYPNPGYIVYLRLKDTNGKVLYELDLHLDGFMYKSKADALDPNRAHGDGVSESKWCLPDADCDVIYSLKKKAINHLHNN